MLKTLLHCIIPVPISQIKIVMKMVYLRGYLKILKNTSHCKCFHLYISFSQIQVGWLRASDQTVLALQERVVTHNARITITHEDFHTWRLRIKQLRETDKGCYMCQINTYVMKKQVGCIDVQGKQQILNFVPPAERYTFKFVHTYVCM